MTDLEFLRAVRAKIDTPEKWTQCAQARRAEGDPVHPWKEEAVAWCLVGAEEAVLDSVDDGSYCSDRLGGLLRFQYYGDMVAWNDAPERTHEEVLALLDGAIERVLFLQGEQR